MSQFLERLLGLLVRRAWLLGLLLPLLPLSVSFGPATPSRRTLDAAPLTVALRSELGRAFLVREIVLTPDGNLRTGSNEWKNHRERQVKLTPEQISSMRRVLADQRFFELSEEYGNRVPDGGTSTLEVKVGDYRKTIRILFLHNDARDEEVKRLVRVCDYLESLSNDPEVQAARRYNRYLLQDE